MSSTTITTATPNTAQTTTIMASPTSPEKDQNIYLLGRSEAETERPLSTRSSVSSVLATLALVASLCTVINQLARLNKQHRFLVAISGQHLIHPAIPQDRITAVADIGTGTGIWLADLATKLPKDSSVYLHGFDISGEQFPPSHRIFTPGRSTSIPLTVHSALHQYPPEHRGRYDFVHIRLLTAGLKQDGYTAVLKHARELLTPFQWTPSVRGLTIDFAGNLLILTRGTLVEPDGWIQWEEVDTTCFITEASPDIPAVTAMRHSVIKAMLKLNLWPFAPQRVYNEITAGGFHNIRRETYTTVDKPSLHSVAPVWVAGVMRALVPPAMVVTGEARDEADAKAQVEILIAEFLKHSGDALPLVNYGATVAQI
ncbi:hypothetical protein N7462_010572, partial [Penicillium macrosclerotiorum]|uniref:uncharacterized protein n=1 Tax=Penicillium macrosclerotiorum TaxID=303699 RepID=UPI002548ECB2